MFSFNVLPFLVPPILFCVSLLLGYIINIQPTTIESLTILSQKLSSTLVLPVVAIIPLGFLLSNITIFVLRMWFWILRVFLERRWRLEAMHGDNFEVAARGEAKDRILNILSPLNNGKNDFDPKDDNFNLYISAVYVNEKLNKRLQGWLDRRDKVFMTLCNCITALFLSYLTGRFIMGFRDQNNYWIAATFLMLVILCFNALITRKQLYGVFDFASRRKISK